MANASEFSQTYAQAQLRRSRHPLRRLIKHFYLQNILCEILGPTIDLGCGAGQLLARLPAGSVGLEVNPFLVSELGKSGLNIRYYDAAADQFELNDIRPNYYTTLVLAHVLEHFDDAAVILEKLLYSCKRLGIKKVIIVLPGAKGFRVDPTHKTFIDQAYFKRHKLLHCAGFSIGKTRYFPINLAILGNYFTYHEFKVIYQQ